MRTLPNRPCPTVNPCRTTRDLDKIEHNLAAPNSIDQQLLRAAEAIRTADVLLIGAGAGMGVDSGLPDFRGTEGFWKAYPPFRGRQFSEMSTPHWFATDPQLAWGFFGHRMNLYRSAVPHAGFKVLRKWESQHNLESFVFTSNVDGQFQKAGFAEDKVLECHGSIHYLQCTAGCGQAIWSSHEITIDVDEDVMRARSSLPSCPNCLAIARPNILMFSDWQWEQARFKSQYLNYQAWCRRESSRRVVAIELGAGLAVPTVRYECQRQGDVLIRINPREADTPQHGIGLALGALEALERLDAILEHK